MNITRSILLLLVVTAIAYAARSFLPAGAMVTGSGAALAFGFLIIAALQVSHVAEAIRFPHLTGYLLCGFIFGPSVLRIVNQPMLDDLALVKGTAIGLIALLAGCELNFKRLRPRLRAIVSISLGSIAVSTLLLAILFYWVATILPVTAGFGFIQKAAVALICANVLAAFSPAVVIGVIRETRARGPLSELSMSIVVLADLAIVIGYSLTSTAARTVFPGAQTAGGMEVLVTHIFGSIAVGAGFGIVLAVYILRVRSRTGLLVFALLFIAAEAGRVLHLDPLLVGLTAGLFLENVSPVGGEEVLRATEAVALPTFAIFFAVVGAELHLHAFLHVAPFAIAAAAVRAAGIYAGTKLAIKAGGVDEKVGRLVPLGLLSQAGVGLALAVLVLNDFQPWGRVLGTVLLGSIVVNQLIGPVLFRFALAKAGEVSPEPENGALQPEEQHA
ncbi:MAG TPA: cation:proton antiporter [Thermoanaerobaculia bacterium]|nr:cation:proton antiporter [Thermoanaerobaculia bacterium]